MLKLIILFVVLWSCRFTADNYPKFNESLDRFHEETIKSSLPIAAYAVISKNHGMVYENYHNADSLMLFGIRSLTKPITTVALLTLVDRGEVSLDDPVEKYLEAFHSLEVLHTFNPTDSSYTTRPRKNELTIRSLLNHTSGITYGLCDSIANALFVKSGGSGGIQSWNKLPLMFDPTSKWHYGMGLRYVGQVIEQVSGMSLEAYCKELIFDPLEMEDTRWNLSDEQLSRLSKAFEGDPENWSKTRWQGAYRQWERGDGGIFSTLPDYTRFTQMLLNEGEYKGRRIISKKMIGEMTRNQIGDLRVRKMLSVMPALSSDFPRGAGVDGFGLGVVIKNADQPNRRSMGSYGWHGLLNTTFWVDPKNEIAVVFYTQVLPFYRYDIIDVQEAFEELIYYILSIYE